MGNKMTPLHMHVQRKLKSLQPVVHPPLAGMEGTGPARPGRDLEILLSSQMLQDFPSLPASRSEQQEGCHNIVCSQGAGWAASVGLDAQGGLRAAG